MCGRFGLFTDLAELVDLLGFELTIPIESIDPSWNIAPTRSILTIKPDGERRVGTLMRWGLIPRWAKPENAFKRPLFNAGSETVEERPMFRQSFVNRRCLVPADGFYEWIRRSGRTGTPMWIHRTDSKAFTFAAVSSIWHGPDGDVESCAILTTSANSLMSPIHHRMPVILGEMGADIWLDDAADRAVLHELMRPREWDDMQVREAHPEVGSAKNDGPGLLVPHSTLFD